MNKKNHRLVGSLDSKNAMENLIYDLQDANSTYSTQNLEIDISSQILSHSQPQRYMKKPLLEVNKKVAKFRDDDYANANNIQVMKQPQNKISAIVDNTTSSLLTKNGSNKKNYGKQFSQSEDLSETPQLDARNQSESNHLKNHSGTKSLSSEVKKST